MAERQRCSRLKHGARDVDIRDVFSTVPGHHDRVADFWVRASVEIDGVKIRHTRRSALRDETAGARMAP